MPPSSCLPSCLRGSLLLLAALAATPLPAALVTGVVTDPAGNYLQDVTLRVPGTGLRTTSDRQGRYRLPDLPDGLVTIEASYLSFAPRTRTVDLSASPSFELNFQLGTEDGVIELEEFRVEASGGDEIAAALSQQRAANNITNVIAADAIGNFPDVNAAEALQRLPGVSIEGQRGEGRFLIVRGAAPNYNSVAMDGAAILSSEADGRTVSLDIFPAEQLSRIEVTKAITPDLPGDSIGGRVNLVTKRAFDQSKRRINTSLYTSYNDLAEDFGYRAGFSFADVFGPQKEWGLQFSFDRTLRVATEQNITIAGARYRQLVLGGNLITLTNRINFIHVDIERLRQSFNATVERRIGSQGYFFVRAIQNQFTEDNTRPLQQINFPEGRASNPVLDADGRLVAIDNSRITGRRTANARQFEDTFRSLAGGGEWFTEAGKLSFQASHTQAQNTQDSTRGDYATVQYNAPYVLDLTDPRFPNLPSTVWDYLNDPDNFIFNSAVINLRAVDHAESAAKLDYEQRQSWFGVPLTWKAGWSSRLAERESRTTERAVRGFNDGNSTALRASDPRLGFYSVDDAFLDGRYAFGNSPHDAAFTRFFTENRAWFGPDQDVVEDYDASEDIHAAYLMGTWTWPRLTLVAGARVEHTRIGFDVRSGTVQRPPNAPPLDPSGDYTNVLPSIHLRYEIRPNFLVRFAWTNSIARPEFDRLAPFETINVDQLTGDLFISRGNPDLEAVKSRNLDFMLESYLPHGGVLSLGFFRKDLDGPIYRSLITESVGGVFATIDSFFNAGEASLTGVEFNYQDQFRSLPGPWSGLGFLVNATVTESRVDVPQRPGEEFPLFRQSGAIGNLALSYDYQKFNARLAFNWRARFLRTVGTDPLTDDYEGSLQKWDFQLGYKYSRRWSLQFEITNLTNAAQVQETGGPRLPTFYALTGRTFSLGLQGRF